MRKLLVPLLSAAIAFGWYSTGTAGGEKEQAETPAIYVSMHPHFLTNLADGKRFVQIKAQAMVSNEATQSALRLHMPAVRHELLMLLGDMQAADLKGVKQKQLFLDNAVAVMREVLTARQAEATDVEAMFITSMVIQ
ncbi:MAG: flagellar basal body-associated FliL family protein [Gammaproteobacteria bacterium]|nr:flagellar basal body-associated FliL family protein [Gammaproteobacteria bacterium]